MKKLILLISAIVLSLPLRAENRIITWTNNDPEDGVLQYNVWQWKGTSAILLTTVSTNRTGLINLKGRSTITITAVNVVGEGPHSTNMIVLNKPEKPSGLDTVP